MHTIGPCAGSVSAQTLVRKLASQACPPVHSLSLLHHQTHLTQSLITEPRWLALGLAPYGTPGTKALLCPPVAAGFGGLRLKKDKKKEQCPCGSGQSLEACCQPYLDSSNGAFLTQPPTAEALLRARFTAFKLKNSKLVTKTTSSCNPARKGSVSADGQVKSTLEQDVKVSQAWIQYEALRILAHRHDEENQEEIFDIEVDIRQLFELDTGKKIKNPPLQTVRETARFGVDEEGNWVSKGTAETNWDREALQTKAA